MPKLTLFGACLLAAVGAARADDLVVHEWGTITSVHRATGAPLAGLNKIDAADVLPEFVHRFEPEPTRQDPKRRLAKSPLVPGRPDVTMRLETPVIYFYPPVGARLPIALDVEVRFRGGVLNEFYPAAEANVLLDTERIQDKQQAGLLSRWDGDRLNNFVVGSLRWKDLAVTDKISPPATRSPAWLAPRDVRATGVATAAGESEHYVFYRGVAHLDALFQTQLMASGLRLSSPARMPWREKPLQVPHVWLVQVRRDGVIAFKERGAVMIDPAVAGQELARFGRFAPEEFAESGARRLRASMQDQLERQGLFTLEAEAMLDTWKASYFEKPGTRVFYIVPREWTDHFLPLRISVPASVTRVIVGRIDLIT